MKKIVFVTGNQKKWQIAQEILTKYNITLEQKKIETPEIQSTSVQEIAEYSAKFAAETLGLPIIKTDVGYYFDNFENFPGPFIKFVNGWFSPNELLGLVNSRKSSKIIIRECLVYGTPDGFVKSFIGETFAKFSKSPEGEGSAIDKIIIREGMDRTQGLTSQEELLDYWAKNLTHFHEMGEFIQKQEI